MKKKLLIKLFSFSYFLNNSWKLFSHCHPVGPRPDLTLTHSVRPSFSRPKPEPPWPPSLNPSETDHQKKKFRNWFDKNGFNITL